MRSKQIRYSRDPQGRFACHSFEAIYDVLDRELKRVDGDLQLEVRRINDLRQADQISLVAALTAAKTAVDAALAAAEKAVAAALIAAKEAVNKAELAQQRTNESQKDFQDQLKDLASSLLPRSEFLIWMESVNEKLDANTTDLGNLRSRIDIGPPSLATLQTRSDENAGRSKAITNYQATILGVAGIAAILVAHFWH
jgi:hypothetical protein